MLKTRGSNRKKIVNIDFVQNLLMRISLQQRNALNNQLWMTEPGVTVDETCLYFVGQRHLICSAFGGVKLLEMNPLYTFM